MLATSPTLPVDQVTPNAAVALDNSQIIPERASTSKLFAVAGFFLTLTAMLYAAGAALQSGIFYQLQKNVGAGLIQRTFPNWIYAAAILLIPALLLLVASTLLARRKAVYLYVALIAVIASQLVVFLISQFLIVSAFQQFYAMPLAGNELGVERPEQSAFQIRFLDASYLTSLIAVVLLLFAIPKATATAQPVRARSWILTTILAVVMIAPTLYFTASSVLHSLDTSYGLNTLKKQVSYHVYSPTTLPEPLEIAEDYYLQEVAGLPNGISGAFAKSVFEAQSVDDMSSIGFSQVGVDETFNVAERLPQQKNGDVTISEIKVLTAKDQKGWYWQKQMGERTFAGIQFITPDNVYIQLVSASVPQQTLHEVAESLE